MYTTVSAAVNTHSHQRLPPLSAGWPNTRHDVSSTCACPAAAFRAAIAAASGASSSSSRRATPASVPGATSRPCIASIAITRLNGSPSAYLATSRFTQNSVVNRPWESASPGRARSAPPAPGTGSTGRTCAAGAPPATPGPATIPARWHPPRTAHRPGRTAGSAARPPECHGPAPRSPGAHAGAAHARPIRPLTPAPPARSAAIPCRGVIPAAGVGGLPARLPLTGAVFLAGGAEQHPAQRHHPLLQRGQLLLLRGHRRGQRGVLRLQPHVLPGQPRVLCLQQLRPLTPERRLISGPGTSTRSHHAKAAPPPVLCPAPPHPPRQRVACAGQPRSAHRNHRILTSAG